LLIVERDRNAPASATAAEVSSYLTFSCLAQTTQLRLQQSGWFDGATENAGVENAGVENAGADRKGGKLRSKPYGKPN